MRTSSSCLALLALAAMQCSAESLNARIVMREIRNGVLIEDLVFPNGQKSYDAAYRICPQKRSKPAPAILFVHWLDPEYPNSNRSQFVEEAVTLARKGACSLLVDSMWSSPDWFNTRDPAKDRKATERQRDRLKGALDFLLESPGIDHSRVAYVGHDFGGMFGALLAGEERRVQWWAFQAATPRWHEWYLLGRKVEGEAREKIIAETAPIDPIVFVAKAKGAFLFQFGTKDPFVPRDRATQFSEAAPQPKKVLWYEAGHDLNAAAASDRVGWLVQSLGLR